MHQIQWYPGHMHKTRRLIAETLPKVDVIFELLDARIPLSSRNPLIEELLQEEQDKGRIRKPSVVLLNKSDLADPEVLPLWIAWFGRDGQPVLPFDSTGRGGVAKLLGAARKAVAESGREIKDRPLKGMIVGIPNVGKSTLFNTLAGNRKAQVGDKPGVTRDFQKVKAGDNLLLFDSPGVLWPKFEDPEVGSRLAVLGSIKDSILPLEEVAAQACLFLRDLYPQRLRERYKMASLEGEPEDLLAEIGRRRGCLVKGGTVDMVKAAMVVLNDPRSGRMGLICLEAPPHAG
jgi:ribosome biogenesis GTPase A